MASGVQRNVIESLPLLVSEELKSLFHVALKLCLSKTLVKEAN